MFAASKTSTASSGYQISRSLRFSQPDSSYLSRTPASAGSRTTWTLSGWLKGFKSNLNNVIYCAGSGANQTGLYIDSANQQLNFYEIQSSSYVGNLVTTQVFRDYSAWYHIVAVYDSTQATASSRMRLYVNGTQVTAFGTATYVPQNTTSIANSAVITEFGNGSGNAAFYDGYMTEIYFVDGQALTASSFGETNAQTGVWQPKAYSGSYGTNGFYLNFSDNSNTTAATLGKDYSGNGNNWTPNNFSVTAGAGNDSLVDSPTSYGTDTGVGGTVRGNYCTWNPVDKNNGSGALTNGNLDATDTNSAGTSSGVRSTLGGASNKWYFEATLTTGSYAMIGVSDLNKPLASGGWGSLNAWTYYQVSGNKYGNGTDSAYGATYTTNDVIGVAFDADAGTITFYKNGTSQGTAFTGLTGKTLSPYFGTASGTVGVTLNTGQRPFAYTAPSGFKALCTQNLPTPTIGATTATLANKYFNPVLYTGTGATQTISTVGFSPGLMVLKNRTSGSSYVTWQDQLRGASVRLFSSLTNAESTDTNGVSAFTSTGFSLGTNGNENLSGGSFVAWSWLANTSGSTNTAGSITSTVSANTTSGFSVVTYTGTSVAGTIGHGLGVAPSMIIVKNRTTNNPGAWTVYHASLGNTTLMFMNTTDAAYTGQGAWNSTSPTSSVFSVGTGTLSVNNITNNFVAYCFAEVAGYSKFGSYTGNGSADGPFVFTGFRPAFILYKRSSTAGNSWRITDSTRSTYNVDNAAFLYPDTTETDNFNANDALDILSNGFKIRTTSAPSNTSGDTYIYMAFASNPFKTSLAR